MTVETPLYGQTEWTIKDNVVYSGTNGAVVGYIEGNVVKSFTGSVISILSNFNNSAESVDLSFITAQSNDIRSGKIGADTSGNPVQGTLPEAAATLNDNVVTVPSGIHNRQTLTVTEAAAPTTSGNVVTVNKGYQAAQKKITVGTAKSAATITPGTSDQTIAADTYLSGKQTIKGDANLTAENIKSGVSIFNVAGTFEGYGTFDLAKVTEYTPATLAFAANSKIVISGFDSGNAYADANGTYYVTTETERESNVFKRIYQHVSGPWKILFDGENADCECGNWLLTPVIGSEDILSFGFTEGKEDISSDEYYFDNWVTGYGEYATLEVTKTSYPATDMVLKGVLATGYSDGEWSFASTEQGFTGFEETPVVDCVYAVNSGALIGSAVEYIDVFPGGSALFALDANTGSADLINGGTPSTYGSGTVLQNGEFCFDNTRWYSYAIGNAMKALKDFTIELDFTITSDRTGMCAMFGNKSSWSSDHISLQWARYGYRLSFHWNQYVDGLYGGADHRDWVNDGKYHHAAIVRKGSFVAVYTDGELTASDNYNTDALNLAVENAIYLGYNKTDSVNFPGRVKHVRVLPFARYTNNFKPAKWVGK